MKPPYRSYYPETRQSLPETEALAGRVLVLPAGARVTSTDIQNICASLRFAVEHSRELRRRDI
jgi:dTDP-4-amino-4,6-dideoxygalactose transaminase